MTEKLTPREKSALVKALSMSKEEVNLWQKLDQRSRKLETTLKSAKLHRSSELYSRLLEAQGDEILFLYLHSKQRIVHDRIRNFLQKHLYLAQEITDREVVTQAGIEPGHPEFQRVKEEMIVARLDGKKFKPPRVEEPAAEPPERAPKKVTKKVSRKAPAKVAAAKPAKKGAVKKAPARKAPARKAPAKNVPAKRAPVKKASAKKTSAKKTPAKKTTGKAPARKSARKKSAGQR
jgi:outer membrane biosynthesis protein TonB